MTNDHANFEVEQPRRTSYVQEAAWDLYPRRGPARVVHAVFQFRGGPGREQEAAEAWAFELTHYFLRAVGEQPLVEYSNGVYTCTGLMTTTHSQDTAPVTVFNRGEPSGLDWCVNQQRRRVLRESSARIGPEHRFDGRDEETR